MMENKLKKELHGFVLTDYEEEERFLRKKHQEGFRFVKSMSFLYYFEKCVPEDVVYRLDFNPQQKQDRERYYKMYEDYGWEHIQDMNDYSYFRKPAAGLQEADMEIFSDDESRYEMLVRIFRKRMIPILVIFMLCVLPQIVRIDMGTSLGVVENGLAFLFGMLFVLYVILIVRCGIGFYRLRRKYMRKIE